LIARTWLIAFLIAYKSDYLVVTKMQGFDIYGAENGAGPWNGASKEWWQWKRLSDALKIPKDDHAPVEVFDGAVEPCQTKIPQLDRVLAVVREFCAIGMESKVAEDGRQALEHTRAVRMAIYSLGEMDIQVVRVILASYMGFTRQTHE
jgi:hypothetical protein